MTAVITDIQRFSVHDGPGIRTTVFTKGCNLRCAWCHNPETLSFEPETLFYPEKCIHCGLCKDGCYAGVRVPCGKEMTVEEILSVVAEDKAYYGNEGGVTLSGGEPTCRPAFAKALFAKCHEEGIRTAIETNMSTSREAVLQAVEEADLVMCDCKDAESARHEEFVGVPLEGIRENIRAVSALGKPLILRTPVIPGVNADEKTIRAIADFASSLPTLLYYELLPYHPLGVSKAEALGKESRQFEKPSKELMESLAAAAREAGIPVRAANITK